MFLAASSGSRQCLMAPWLFGSSQLCEAGNSQKTPFRNLKKIPRSAQFILLIACQFLMFPRLGWQISLFYWQLVLSSSPPIPCAWLMPIAVGSISNWWSLAVVLVMPNICPNIVWFCFFCDYMWLYLIVYSLYDILCIYIYYYRIPLFLGDSPLFSATPTATLVSLGSPGRMAKSITSCQQVVHVGLSEKTQ